MKATLETNTNTPTDNHNISPFLFLIFNKIDVDRSGTLDKYEIKQLFQTAQNEIEIVEGNSHGIINDTDLDILLNRIDTNGDGHIDFTEFTKAFHDISSMKDLIDTSYLHLLFTKIDKDASDTIEHHEILSLFDNTDDITETDKQTILRLIDEDFDGIITFHEFKKAFRSLNCKSERDLVEKSYLRLIFDKLDENKNKYISIDEWRKLFIQHNIILSERELYRLVDVFDADGDGEIDFYEFQNVFKKIKSIPELIKKSRLHVIFNNIDTDRSNSLDFTEIKTLFVQENVVVNDENLHYLIDIIDKNGDGQIDFDEFEEAFDEIESIDELMTKWSQLISVDVGSDLSISSALHCTDDTALSLSLSALLPIVAGGTGGICSRTTTAPLERVKILAQCGSTNQSILRTWRQIIHTEGFFRGLWRGNMLNCLRVFPFGGLVTYSYSNITKVMPTNVDNKTKYMIRFGAGVVAGGIATTLTYPLDLIRTQIQASVNAKTIQIRDIKLTNMFKGLRPTLFAMSLFVGTQNVCYDYLRLSATARNGHGLGMKPSIELFVGCGMTAGLIAQTVVYPIDVIRRRIQVNSESVKTYAPSQVRSITRSHQIVANRTWMALQSVVAKEGIKSVFAGLTPTYLKTVPCVAISVTVRDIMLGRLKSEED